MLKFLFVGGSGPILNTALKTRQWTKQINQCFITLLINEDKDNQKEVPCRLIVWSKQHRALDETTKKDAKGSRTQHNKTNKNNQSLRNSLRHKTLFRYRKIFQKFHFLFNF